MFLIPAGRPDIPTLERFFRAQIRLRERRTPERDAGLAADDQDCACEALLPQRGSGVAARDAAADDDDPAAVSLLRHGAHSAAPPRSEMVRGCRPRRVRDA